MHERLPYRLPYRLLALDVDGTLLDSAHQLRPRLAVAIRAATAAGLTVTLATGKQFHSIRPLLAELGLSGPQICLNGAVVTASESGAPIAFTPLADADRGSVIEAVRAARPVAPDALISQFALDAIFVDEAQAHSPQLDVFEEYGEQRPTLVRDLLMAPLPPAAKILVAAPAEQIPGLRAAVSPALEACVYITTTMPEFLEFFAFAANKGQALATLGESLGIPREATIAVGDGENDIPMLRAAGLGVAMGNAGPATLAVADRVIPSSDEDGLAIFLEDLLPRYAAGM